MKVFNALTGFAVSMFLTVLSRDIANAAHSPPDVYTYKMILYFGDTTPYEDELRLEFHSDGKVTGHMKVPNDFEADIERGRVEQNSKKVKFHLTLPSKYDQMFPGGLDYNLEFPVVGCSHSFCPEESLRESFTGIIYSPRNSIYIGSVVGFSKVKTP